MLIVCICISEELFWVIPYNEISIKGNLNISKRSKYNIYKTERNVLAQTILSKASECKQCTLEEGMIPVSTFQKR